MKKLIIAAWLVLSVTLAQDVSDLIEPYLTAGQLEGAQQGLTDYLEQNPDNSNALFASGFVSFLQSVETLVQDFHTFGLYSDRAAQFGLPILRLPTPPNDVPQTISYDSFRGVLETFVSNLTTTAALLEKVEGEVRLPLRFGQIRLDLDADGVATEQERFWYIFTQYNQQAAFLEEAGQLSSEAKDFRIALDKGDVHWLLGYTHLIMAMCEFYLGHNGQDLFERTAHLFYPKVETPHDFLSFQSDTSVSGFDLAFVMDVVSLFHLVHLEPAEPERLVKSLGHLEEVIRQSRLSWEEILAETDNEREWIPNADQQSVLPAGVDQERIDGWLTFLDEAEALLKGEKLIPFWRVQDERGINLRSVFLAPTTFDLVLWIQGSAATPYLEEGELSQGEIWQQLQDIFGGNFLGFAIWFN